MNQTKSDLHGKLAWNYLQSSSLWARHARSRYHINGKGSCLWKTISPYITILAHNCRWKLNNGHTKGLQFCQNLAVQCPGKFKKSRIKDVLKDPLKRNAFLDKVNPRLLNSIHGDFTDKNADVLIWDGDPSGEVTAANFRNSCDPKKNKNKKFEVLWQKWLPLKISFFLWKIYHHAFPFYENLIKIGIQHASKCVCCSSPSIETMEHFFIFSDKAASVFDILCTAFKRPRPRSMHQLLFDWGLNVDLTSFTNCLGFGLICCCLWELWKWRNNYLYDDQIPKFSSSIIFRWTSLLTKTIKIPYIPNSADDLLCAKLHTNPTQVKEWKCAKYLKKTEETGVICNIAIIDKNESSLIAAVIRDTKGNFISALKFVTKRKHFLHCIYHCLNEILKKHIVMHYVKISHEDAVMLGKNIDVEWEVFRIKRRIVTMMKGIKLIKVSHGQNISATTLCWCHQAMQFMESPKDLPIPVRHALNYDSFPRLYVSSEMRIFI